MKKLSLIIVFSMILLTGCKTTDKVKINANIQSYIPTMSSAQGIRMTPDLKTKKSYDNIIYHWETSEGEFINEGKEAEMQSGYVVWAPRENGSLVEIENTITIKLEVINADSKKVLASTNLTIKLIDGFYVVEE